MKIHYLPRLISLACILSPGMHALAQPSTQYGDNFDSYSAGAAPAGFSSNKNGSVNTHSWTVSGTGTNKQLRCSMTNQTFAGGGISSSIRGMPYMGGLNQKEWVLSTTARVVTAASSYHIALSALSGTQPNFLGSYYRASISNTGTVALHSSNGGTSGLILGTATNLSGGLVVGTTYTLTLRGTYNSGALNLEFTVTGGANTASITGTAATPLTGVRCGYEVKVNPSGGSMTVDFDNLNASIPMTFSQVWADEFTGTTLNTAVWNVGYRWADIINNELQAMRPENVSVGSGVLRVDVTNPVNGVQNQDMNGWQGGAMMDYASGGVQTYNRWTKTYGYFEARIKMPTGKGTWPAFWLLPDRGLAVQQAAGLTRRVEVGDNGYGRGSEIDVTEYMAAWKNPTTNLSRSHSGLIWSYASGGGTANAEYALTGDGFGGELEYANADTAFHTYGVYWEPGICTFYLDGKVVYTVQNATYVPNIPHYLILSVAITQNDWHGNTIPLTEISAGLPCFMEVDYVRVYDVTPGAAQSRAPQEDTYGRDGTYQNQIFGTAQTVAVKNDTGSYNREAFLKFDVSGLGSAPNVRLRIVPTGQGASAATVRFDSISNDTWTEATLTWANRPTGTGVAMGTRTGPFTLGTPIEIDVTSQAQAAANSDGVLSIRIVSTVNGFDRAVDFGSKENSTASFRPALVY